MSDWNELSKEERTARVKRLVRRTKSLKTQYERTRKEFRELADADGYIWNGCQDATKNRFMGKIRFFPGDITPAMMARVAKYLEDNVI